MDMPYQAMPRYALLSVPAARCISGAGYLGRVLSSANAFGTTKQLLPRGGDLRKRGGEPPVHLVRRSSHVRPMVLVVLVRHLRCWPESAAALALLRGRDQRPQGRVAVRAGPASWRR